MEHLYQCVSGNKSDAKVNVCRILQPLELLQCETEFSEIKLQKEEIIREGPIRSSAKITSRSHKQLPPPPEYILNAKNNSKKRTWKGRSEESGKYAVVIKDDDNKLKFFLIDHWYKFSQVYPEKDAIEENKQPAKPVLGQQKVEQQEKKQIQNLCLDDSEEELNLPRKRVREYDAKQDRTNAENLDFDEKFDDDEEDQVSQEDQNITQSKDLTEPGKQLQKALQDETNVNKDDNGMLQGLDKLTIINELIRLGKIEMKDFITNLRRKYSIGIDAEFKAWLATILREVAEVTEQGGANYLQIKEKYKRSMPSHGERVDFQSR